MRLTVLFASALLAFAPVTQADDASPRVVSADGSITETVYALGAQERLVGTDTTSNYPMDVRSLPKVGYLRALPVEGVLALRPDVLLTSEEAGPAETLERLERAGVEVVRLPVARTPGETLERIKAIGKIVGHTEQARVLVDDMSLRMQAAQEHSGIDGARVLFLMVAGNHGVMIAGRNTAADALLRSLGAENAVAEVNGYKPAGREALLVSQPDAVVVAEARSGQFKASDWPQLVALEAWKQGHFLIADSMMLLGFGPRLPEAMEELSAILDKPQDLASHGS